MQISENRGNYKTAHQKLNRSIKSRKLIRKDYCEICGHNKETDPHLRIVGHHWKGYDFPLDVWWVCSQCNGLFHDLHDGSLTIEKAKEIALQRGHFCKRCFLASDAGRIVYKRVKKFKPI